MCKLKGPRKLPGDDNGARMLNLNEMWIDKEREGILSTEVTFIKGMVV